MVRYYLKRVWKKKGPLSWKKKVAHEKVAREFRSKFSRSKRELVGYRSLKCRTIEWAIQRSFRIASTVVRRACSCNYMPTNEIITTYSQKDVGLCVENDIVEFFHKHMRPSGLHVHYECQWLCTTPDAHHIRLDIPVEIKYNRSKASIQKVIAKNYHQLQFQMFCTYKRQLLMIVYDGSLTCALIDRDDHFIKHCLYKLRVSIVNIISHNEHPCGNSCSFVDNLIPLPYAKPNKSSFRTKRKYAYNIVKLEHIFPHTTLAAKNSLLARMRASIGKYEAVSAHQHAARQRASALTLIH